MAEKIMREFLFAQDDMTDVDSIVEKFVEVGAAATYKNFGAHGIIEKVELDNYKEKENKVKEACVAFAAGKAGLNCPKTATEVAYALDNGTFRDILNTIMGRTIGTMIARYTSPQLDALVEVQPVEVGASYTYEIETKALPVAQIATYGSNVTMVPSYAIGSKTLKPIPYSVGISLDYVRIIANGYDWGRAIARVYAGMLFAQYNSAVSVLFNTNALNGTPFYNATFSGSSYVQLASDIKMLNGGAGVTAYGTLVAWQTISALATQGGFTTKDEYIRNAFLQKIFGVDSMVLDQFTNYAAPFTTANAASLRAIPDNLIVLISASDKPVKLARENYIRVIETPANNNTLNRNEYSFFQSFDTGIATASQYGLQSTQSA